MDGSRFAPPAPDAASAAHAFDLAADMLSLAKELFSEGDLQAALQHSRDSMRLASSAILFRDGYVTDDFDKTVRYLSRRYDSIFPLRDWERVEMTYLGTGGLYNMILKAMGKQRKSDREMVAEALSIAERFVETARMELGQ
jgi:HEPN domain-containing protein